MFITLCVIAYNEENTINSILEDINAQTYPHDKMEVVLVDGNSTDRTKAIMQEFADKCSENGFVRVKVLDNNKRTLPCGWNVALSEYKGDAIIKVDAHAHIPQDFVEKNVAVLNEGEYICGGQRPNIIDEPTQWKKTLLMAESSMFGSSIAPYRNNPGKTYVKSLFHAAYRREVFDKIGGFNEDLARTEDNEIHYRMRKAGFKLRFEPDIISYQHTRSSLPKMLKQKYANGYWIGLTSGVCKECLSAYHFVPFLFVLAIILSTVLSTVFGMLSKTGVLGNALVLSVPLVLARIVWFCTGLMWGVYWLVAVLMAVLSVISEKEKRNITCIALPILFFLLHISYGIGTLVGMIKLPSFKAKLKEKASAKKGEYPAD